MMKDFFLKERQGTKKLKNMKEREKKEEKRYP